MLVKIELIMKIFNDFTKKFFPKAPSTFMSCLYHYPIWLRQNPNRENKSGLISLTLRNIHVVLLLHIANDARYVEAIKHEAVELGWPNKTYKLGMVVRTLFFAIASRFTLPSKQRRARTPSGLC